MRVFVWILIFVVLLLGIGFSALNAGVITVNYLVGTISVPLAAVILGAFVIGVLLAGLLLGVRVIHLQHKVKVLRDHLVKSERLKDL